MDQSEEYFSALSMEARQFIQSLPPHEQRPVFPAATDLQGWHKRQEEIERRAQPSCQKAIATSAPLLEKTKFARLEAIKITPRDCTPNKAPVIFLHGGAYLSFSAQSSLYASIPLAIDLDRCIISINYPLAPATTFKTIVYQTALAIKDICDRYKNTSLIGDSAGGGLALATTHYLIKTEAPAPVALALFSPWTDLSNQGGSHTTVGGRDPILRYEPELRIAAQAYAPGHQMHSAASPLNAIYTDMFPHTLIQCGTCEILHTDATRQYEKMKTAGVKVQLNAYEGLYHSFQTITPATSEARTAKESVKQFIDIAS